MIRFAARLLGLGVFAYFIMTLAMLAWTFLWPEPDLSQIAPADAIICLGGGMWPDGTLAAPVLTRIERCVQIYNAGLAPVIVFSGGTAARGGPSAGDQMARYAQSLGVPQGHTLAETRAQSTLQNAIFSLDMVGDARDFIVVTEAFHLPRAWASFHWAWWQSGAPLSASFQLVMSEKVRNDPDSGGVAWKMLARESIAIWFNVARATAYSLSANKPIEWLH